MTQIYSIVSKFSWAVGLLSMIAAVVIKLMRMEAKLTVSSHTMFLIAATLFLCALATREMGRS